MRIHDRNFILDWGYFTGKKVTDHDASYCNELNEFMHRKWISRTSFQQEGQLIYFGEREIVVSNELPDYQLKGWNADGRYFMTIIPDPNDSNKEIIFLHDFTVPESFPLITDIDVDAINPIYFGIDKVLFTETTPRIADE